MNATATVAHAPAVDPDAHLIDLLNEDIDAIDRAGQDATQAFRAATALPFAPIALIGAAWETAKTAYGHAQRAVDLADRSTMLAARIELLRIALATRDEMQRFASMSQDERQAASGAKPAPVVPSEIPGSRLNGPEILTLAQKAGLDINLSNGSDLEIHGDLEAHPDVHLILQHQKRQVVGHLLGRRGRVI